MSSHNYIWRSMSPAEIGNLSIRRRLMRLRVKAALFVAAMVLVLRWTLLTDQGRIADLIVKHDTTLLIVLLFPILLLVFSIIASVVTYRVARRRILAQPSAPSDGTQKTVAPRLS